VLTGSVHPDESTLMPVLNEQVDPPSDPDTDPWKFPRRPWWYWYCGLQLGWSTKSIGERIRCEGIGHDLVLDVLSREMAL